MSKGPEGKYIDKVHRQLDASIYKMSNTNPYIGGIPDYYYEGKHGNMWIEYKYVEKFPDVLDCTGKNKKLLTSNQTAWLRRASKNGVEVHVVIGCKDGTGIILSNLSWEVLQNTKILKKYTPKEVASKIASTLLKPLYE